jgi:hypothetical protein
MQWREVIVDTRKNMFRVSKKGSCFLGDQPWTGRKGYKKICWMGSFTIKKQSKLSRGPYQTPIAIQTTTTVFATSDSIRLLRFAILNQRIWVGLRAGIKTVAKKIIEESSRWFPHADKGLSPVSGKADHVLFSFVLVILFVSPVPF